jgi:hypothetical protein
MNSPVTETKSSFLWCNPRQTKNQRNTIFSMDLPSNPTQKFILMTHFHSNWDSLLTVHKGQGRTIDTVLLNLHCKSNHRKRLGIDGIFVALSRVRCRSSICLIKHTHTSFEEAYGYISRLKPSPDVMADTFQDSGQLLHRLHRHSTGGTSLGHASVTWFNQLIPSYLLYFITSSNTSSFRLTRFITACRVV